jgi:CRISPR/Cas system Type II protein with McrA/HNH and RuvC-like nuclease domain
MGIVRTGETEYEKELAKWDKPYVHQAFPKMVYRAIKVNGAVTVLSTDGEHDQKCTKIVGSDRELSAALSSGWHPDPKSAYDALEHADRAHADDAAVVAYEASKMSPKAKREYKRRSAATDKHIVD